MAEKVKCETCNQTFKDENGLAQHKSAKHAPTENKPQVNTKRIKNWAIFIVIISLILILIIWLIYSTFKAVNYCKVAPAEEIDIGGHSNLALHIHSILHIIIDDKEQIIPANIGILPNIMRPLHTHAADNEIHIEGPCARDFKLGEFFKIWGKQFSSQCIFDKCTSEGKLTMTVNGIPTTDFENHILKDHDEIIIEYNKNS